MLTTNFNFIDLIKQKAEELPYKLLTKEKAKT